MQVVRACEQHASLCKKYQKRFLFISVDEYQDINHGQYRLIRLLATQDHDLFVIGDPAQAIYGFRGADVRYVKRFQDDYPDAVSIRLHQNYRSTETILRAATQVLSLDVGPSGKEEIWSGMKGLETLTVAELPTEDAESAYVVNTIEAAVGGTSHFSLDAGWVSGLPLDTERSFSDFAVLFRTREQARMLESAFNRSGIPFQGQGRGRAEDQPGNRLVLSFLKMIWGVATGMDVERVLASSLTGCDRPTLKGIEQQITRAGNGLIALICGDGDISHMESGVAEKITGFREKICKVGKQFEHRDVFEQIQSIPEIFSFDETLFKNRSFQHGLTALEETARPFRRDHLRFLTALALHREQDCCLAGVEKVTLITMHASKGLEFPVVFIVGCEDGLVPYRRKGRTVDLREEERLFYVALTRAKEQVCLCHVQKRRQFGKVEHRRASPFLASIEDRLKKHISPTTKTPFRTKRPSQLSLFQL